MPCEQILARTGLPQRAILVAATAFPAVAINLLHGHNGFLTAGLLAWGLIVLPRRPLLAGALFALLAYKPQFALAIPVALIAGGAWRSLAAAAFSFVALTAATLAAFGTEPWRAFWAGTGFTRRIVLEAGATGFEKIQTVFAAVRLAWRQRDARLRRADACDALHACKPCMALAHLPRANAVRLPLC